MVLGLLLAVFSEARAVDVWIDVPHEPPATLSLFSKAEVLETRATLKEDDCPGAMQEALRMAEEKGQVLRVVVAADDLAEAAKAMCRQRVAGEEITASVVALHSLVVSPGSSSAVYPEITAERAMQVAALLSVMGGESGMAPIDDIDGKGWVRLTPKVLGEELDVLRYDPRERGQRAFENVVRPWIVQWVNVIQGIPEVHGAVMVVEADARDPSKSRRKGRRREVFRYAVPTDVAVRFDRGDLLTEEFMALVRTDWAPDARKPEYQLLPLSDEAENAPVEASNQRERALPTADDDLPDDAAPE